MKLRWMGEHIGRLVDAWLDGWTADFLVGQMDGWMEKQKDEWVDGC